MKKLNKCHFWVLIAAFIVVLIVMLLYFIGFRITYSPELETSWDAISACAAWAGAVMSFFAVMVAVWIPKKIADRQDKIALFEIRYKLYYDFYRLYRSCDNLWHSYKKIDFDLKQNERKVYKEIYLTLVNNKYLQDIEDVIKCPKDVRLRLLFLRQLNEMNEDCQKILCLFTVDNKESIEKFFKNYISTLDTLCRVNDKSKIIYNLQNLETSVSVLLDSYSEIHSARILDVLFSQIKPV